jgi:exosome complex RNA-binding protein Rrp42 (RNase PH superfamily)
MATTLSQSECDYIRGGCRDNCRSDGRTRHEYRTFAVTNNVVVVPLSHGSSRVRSVTTGDDDNGEVVQYVASVKAEIVAPSLQRPSDGCIEIALVYDALGNSSSSSSSSNSGSTGDSSLELRQAQSALQDRVPWLPDMSSLCIVPHVAVWKLYVDVYIVSPLRCGGSGTGTGVNLEAATHCINAALLDTVLPKVTVPNDSWNNDSDNNNALMENTAKTAAAAAAAAGGAGGSVLASTASDGVATTDTAATSSFLDRLVVDSDLAHATRLVSSRHDLPLLVTLCAVVVATKHESYHTAAAAAPSPHNTAMDKTNHLDQDQDHRTPPPVVVERLWLWDATAAEQCVAASTVHVVLTRRRQRQPLSSSAIVTATATAATVPITLDQPEWDIVSVWKTGSKSLPLAALSECLALAQQAAPVALQHYQYGTTQPDCATTTTLSPPPAPMLGWFPPPLTIHS